MKRLGTVLHTIDNLLIVRADKTLKPDALSARATVVTKGMKKIGRLEEPFGPVKNPYVSIKMFKGAEMTKLRNERVYLA